MSSPIACDHAATRICKHAHHAIKKRQPSPTMFGPLGPLPGAMPHMAANGAAAARRAAARTQQFRMTKKPKAARKTKGIVAEERGPQPLGSDTWDTARPREGPADRSYAGGGGRGAMVA